MKMEFKFWKKQIKFTLIMWQNKLTQIQGLFGWNKLRVLNVSQDKQLQWSSWRNHIVI